MGALAAHKPNALTPHEDAILQRVHSRLLAYFEDFEVLEGFTVLTTNIHRLFQKVMLEVRSVLFEVHDMSCALHALQEEHARQERDLQRQQVLSHALVSEAQALLVAMHDLKERSEHNAAHARSQHIVQVAEMRQELELESERRQQEALDALRQRFEQQVAQLESETEIKFALVREQLEAQKACEMEYARTRLRLQLKSQLEGEYQHKLAVHEDRLARQQEQLRRANNDAVALRAKLHRNGH